MDPFVPAENLTTDQLLEAIVMRSEREFGKSAFVDAKERFQALFGKVFPEGPFYETRMSYFLDYFVFLRPLPAGTGAPTAFLRFCNEIARMFDSGGNLAGPLVRAMESFRHSLFQIVNVPAANSMTIRDMRTGATYDIRRKTNESFCGFTRDAVFQGFVFPDGDHAYLGNGLIMHPPQAVSIIRKFLKKAESGQDFDEQAILARLAWVQLKALRHNRAGAKRIYGAEIGNF